MNCVYCENSKQLSSLAADELVAQFEHSYALLAPYQYFTGYCILVSRVHARELHELSDDVRRGYLDEMNHLSKAISVAFQPRKLNCELLGNQVQHPHWHIIPRYESDPNHLKPAWLAMDLADRDDSQRGKLIGAGNRLEIANRIRERL